MSFVKLSIFGTSFEVRKLSNLHGARMLTIGIRSSGYDSLCRPPTSRYGRVYIFIDPRSL